MSETPAQRELARQVARLDREAQRFRVEVSVVCCAQHGPQYACVNSRPYQVWKTNGTPALARCGHIACRQIVAGNCPECETP